MSYLAIVAELKNVRIHPGADRLKLADVQGYQIVVGLESQEGDIVILFPPDGKLSEEYLVANDLRERKDPITGERAGGYFGKSGRIKTQKLRGEKSEAYIANIDSLDFAGKGKAMLSLGDQFDTFHGVKICEKYFSEATLKAMKGGTQQTKRVNKCFPKHIETEKFQYEADKIPVGSLITITEKLHGTSGRYAYVRDEQTLPQKWWERLLKRPVSVSNDYEYMVGTRNVILGKSDRNDYYDDPDFRHKVFAGARDLLNKGEIVYGEIVGYTSSAPIMGEHNTSELKDIKKKYGPKIVYSYGCEPGQCDFYVYRIAQINDDGDLFELSWNQVKRRAKQLGLKVVPEFYGPILISQASCYPGITLIQLKKDVEWLMDGCSSLDDRHIREGVVVRVDEPDGTTNWLKSKSFEFGVLEGYLKAQEDSVDLEEIS